MMKIFFKQGEETYYLNEAGVYVQVRFWHDKAVFLGFSHFTHYEFKLFIHKLKRNQSKLTASQLQEYIKRAELFKKFEKLRASVGIK